MDTKRPPTSEYGGLMAAASQGDQQAYAQLLTAVTPLIRYTVARRWYFRGPVDVEDIVQDVLLSMHAVRATYDPARPFLPWLLAIVRHRVADAARTHVRSASRQVPLDEGAVTFAPADPNTYGGQYADLDALRVAIESLPQGQRSAVELLKLQELSLREGAAASGTSVGALKVATHRAMSTLRRMLSTNEH